MIQMVQNDAPLPPPVFKSVIAVRWGDMDAEGHVNNTGYIRFMEETRMQWVVHLGIPTVPPHPVIVLLNAACHYHSPLTYPATVEVSLSLGRIGRTSVQTYYAIEHLEIRQQCAEGFATLVWYDLAAKKAIALPPALRVEVS